MCERRPVLNFQEAEGEYKKLKAQLDAGTLTEEQFEARLQAVMVQDQQGRWWTIGGATGQWYVHDGVNWVIGEPSAPTPPPPGRPSGAAPEAKATPPPVPPVQSNETAPSGRKPWLWAVLGVLVVVILAVLLSRLVPEPAANTAPKQTQAAPIVTPTASAAARALSPVSADCDSTQPGRHRHKSGDCRSRHGLRPGGRRRRPRRLRVQALPLQRLRPDPPRPRRQPPPPPPLLPP